MDEWRNNFKGMTWFDPRTNLNIAGAVDDIWQDRATNKLVVVDYKATAKKDKVTLDVVTPDDEWKNTYKRQMEVYMWLLRKQGFDVEDRGFFLYANGRKGEGFEQKIELMFPCFRMSQVATGSSRSCSTSKPA